jgi:hypothetical protein
MVVEVKGKKVRIPRTPEYEVVLNVRVGRDGSLAITRRSEGEMYSVNDFIRVKKKERLVEIDGHEAWITDYVGARNYTGYYYASLGVGQYPESAPTAFRVTEGRLRKYGDGLPLQSWSNGDLLVRVPVDGRGRPAGAQSTVATLLRMYSGSRRYEIGRFDFVGSSPDGTLILSSRDELVRWRNGRFLGRVRLPSEWRPIRVNRHGDVLLRRAPAGAPDLAREALWEAAILRAGKLHRLQFSRPADTRDLLWRETHEFTDQGAVRFHAFLGPVDKEFELVRR